MSNESTLRAAFSEGLGIKESDVDWSSLTYRGIKEWDSVAHMQVVAEIEDAFDIMIEIDDVIAMSDFGVTKSILEKYGIQFD